MSNLVFEQSAPIYAEMMSHTALFSHPLPETVTLIGEDIELVLAEVLKHDSVQRVWQTSCATALTDPRVHAIDKTDWLSQAQTMPSDVCIILEPICFDMLQHAYKNLQDNGYLIQKMGSMFDIASLQAAHSFFHSIGFSDTHILNFPQLDVWRSAFFAKKQGTFRKIREKDIFNKNFTTSYYNFDTHRAALAVPEFIRHALGLIEEI